MRCIVANSIVPYAWRESVVNYERREDLLLEKVSRISAEKREVEVSRGLGRGYGYICYK